MDYNFCSFLLDKMIDEEVFSTWEALLKGTVNEEMIRDGLHRTGSEEKGKILVVITERSKHGLRKAAYGDLPDSAAP